MRKLLHRYLFILLSFIALQPAFSQSSHQSAYYCLPCDKECDNIAYKESGKCPKCGMALALENVAAHEKIVHEKHILTNPKTSAQKNKAPLIDAYLNEIHHAGLFNGNILIVDHGKIITKKAIGYADASKKIMLNTQYRFHIGSIAKEFDAVGIMMLQEQGKLNIDNKVSKFFPELPAWAQKVSIKNLLQYTSGLPEVKWQTVHSDADNWNDIKSLQELDSEPGNTYAYNNNNTFLRRRIIEKVTGISFNQFVQQNILPKAGISKGIVDPTDIDTLVAKSFNNDFKQDGLQVPISGWTCLNLDDFYKWAQCIVNFCVINPASTRTIITPFASDEQCGLGGGTMQGNKVITHVHDGTALHYQALVSTDVAKGRTIIILSNQRQNNVYDIAAAINTILDIQLNIRHLKN